MSISIKKLGDHDIEVTVAKTSTTTHTVTVSNQSLTHLTDNKVKKTQLLGFCFLVSSRKRTRYIYSVVIRYQSNFEILFRLQRCSQKMVR